MEFRYCFCKTQSDCVKNMEDVFQNQVEDMKDINKGHGIEWEDLVEHLAAIIVSIDLESEPSTPSLASEIKE